MIPASCKRLIEVDFPIAAVSQHSAREKSIRHGHPSTLHLWWARRPLAACRSVLLGLLLPDPCDRDCPADFKTKARELLAKRYGSASQSDEALRELLLKFIGEFANWDHAANALYLDIGRGLVKAAHPEETPVVVDPFAGGGSIPLEALRLGCEAFASDLNPVACLILKTLLEDIPRYGNAEFKLADGNGKEVVVHGLGDALRHVGKHVKKAAEKELAQFYPPDPDGSRPIAYLWARTVRCEGIGCGAEIPLLTGLWLCKKANRRRALRFKIERQRNQPPQITFEVFQPKSETEVQKGLVRHAEATCPCCNVVVPAERVRAQLLEQRGGADVRFDARGKRSGGARLLAVVTLREDASGRSYRVATDDDYVAVLAAQKAATKLTSEALPDERVNTIRPSPNARGLSAPTRYGIQSFSDIFTSRQKLSLATAAACIRGVEHEGLKELLAVGLSRGADYGSAHTRWHLTFEKVTCTFGRQALPMTWDFVEPLPFGDTSGGIGAALDTTLAAVNGLIWLVGKAGRVENADACESPIPDATSTVWFTDPPYYDSIPYADLSDYFFVWLKRVLPSHALLKARLDDKTGLTPKTEECVWNQSYVIDGKPKDGEFFERTIGRAFRESRRVLKQDGVGCVVFAHKTTEGWEALLSGMVRAGWIVTASWPIATERAARQVARDSAALAGSVHLVCRPRSGDAGVGDWSEVKAAMEKRIQEWLPTLLKHGVRGADAIFSCLGPALESYSRYEKVLTAADREVPLGGDPDANEPHERGFLAYVFETLSKEALRQVLGDAETEGFEEDSRMTALFLWTLQSTKADGNGKKEKPADDADDSGDEEDDDKPKKAKAGFSMPFDTFIRITRPMGIHYAALEHRVIEIEKGVVRLLPVRERSEQLLGEAATRPGAEISLEDVAQLELGLLMKRREESALPAKGKRGKKPSPAPGRPAEEAEFTTLDRLHRAMLLFGLGRSTLLRQVLEKELRESKRFERLALALNALYPDGTDERRLLEGVQAAMRGVR